MSACAAVGVRIGSITTTSPRASRSQCSCACGALADGFAPQTTMQAALGRGLRGSKPVLARAVDVVERDVAGVVADGVRLDLGRAQAVEEALRERVSISAQVPV